MSNEKIKELVDQLLAEVETSKLDSEATEKLRSFETAIDPYINGEKQYEKDQSILDKANVLEVTFAQNHPTAEGIVRQIMNTLIGMGV